MINFDNKFIIEMSKEKYKTWNEINSLAIEKGIYFQQNFSIGMNNPSESELNSFLLEAFPLIEEEQLLEGKMLTLKNIYDYYENIWLPAEEREIYEIVASLFKYFCEIKGTPSEELKRTNDISFVLEKTMKLAKEVPENKIYDQNKYNELIELSKSYSSNKK